MNQERLNKMDLAAVVKRFEKLAERLSQVNFELVSPMDMPGREEFDKEAQQLHSQLKAIDAELRSRGREARLALVRLYDNPNLEVQLQAALHTLGVTPEFARNQLKAIAKTSWTEGIAARDTIRSLDNGNFKPD